MLVTFFVGSSRFAFRNVSKLVLPPPVAFRLLFRSVFALWEGSDQTVNPRYQDTMKANTNDVTRVVRVSRIFGHTPVSVLVHTDDGRREKIRITNWDHINTDTGGINESGWEFIEDELNRIFGTFEWAVSGMSR